MANDQWSGADVTRSVRSLLEGAARSLDGPLLIGRVMAGVTMLVMPGVVADIWLNSRSRRSRWFVRAVGVRDLLISAGQRRTLPPGQAGWRWAAVAADLADAAIALDRAVVGRRPATATIAVPALGSALLTGLTTSPFDHAPR
jgi:hypothetical protein